MMDVAVTLESEDVRADAVQKIAVVADHADHARKRDQGLFEHAQGRQIKIIGRFIQHEKISAALQNARQQQPAALAAGKVFDLRRDAFIGKEKPFQIAAQGNFGLAPLHKLRAVGRLVQNGALLVQLQPRLVHIIEFGELAGFHRAFRGRKLANDNFQQGRFAQTVSSADADAPSVFESEVESVEKALARPVPCPRSSIPPRDCQAAAAAE